MTIILITHHTDEVVDADRIILMKDGKIIEKGNHEQLLAAGGFYKKLWSSQFESAPQNA